ncbi:triphosphoribosyl-dephospho-CoA synthase, partial [Klebsiella quasipneumoniae]|uniref:triphosphoribosyl-dephospho-CoA synthase n=1 Tax=Klebsiella quasipneumoniae TaxID=1463165 RepID=UPI003F4EAA42
ARRVGGGPGGPGPHTPAGAGGGGGGGGGPPPPPPPAALARLDAQMLAHNASPGGAADLLAATLFLDRVAG